MIDHQTWTTERRWLAALIAATIVTLIASAGLPLGPLQVLAGTVATLCAPGYAFLLAVQPRRLPFVNRLVLSVPLSLAVVIILGLALNASPLGVHQRGLAALACGVTLALLAVASKRGHAPSAQQWRDSLGSLRSSLPGKRQVPQIGVKSVLISLVALALIAWAGVGLYTATRPVPTYYTEFAIASAAPATDQSATIRLDISNYERTEVRYLVRIIHLPTNPADSAAAATIEREIDLAVGATGSIEVTIAFACGDSIEAHLWLADDPNARSDEPYRRLRALPDCMAGTRP